MLPAGPRYRAVAMHSLPQANSLPLPNVSCSAIKIILVSIILYFHDETGRSSIGDWMRIWQHRSDLVPKHCEQYVLDTTFFSSENRLLILYNNSPHSKPARMGRKGGGRAGFMRSVLHNQEDSEGENVEQTSKSKTPDVPPVKKKPSNKAAQFLAGQEEEEEQEEEKTAQGEGGETRGQIFQRQKKVGGKTCCIKEHERRTLSALLCWVVVQGRTSTIDCLLQWRFSAGAKVTQRPDQAPWKERKGRSGCSPGRLGRAPPGGVGGV